MKFTPKIMTEDFAREILTWQYDSPYDLYNQDAEDFDELMNGSYYAVLNFANEMIGFYCIGTPAQVPKGHDFKAYQESFLDLGLGLKPELTGQGNGYDFLEFIIPTLSAENLRLTVASFNKRAIRLYEKFGFKQVDCFSNGKNEFITMVRDGCICEI